MVNSLGDIFENDQGLDDELVLDGIVDVRLREDTQGSALTDNNGNTSNPTLGTGDSNVGGRPAMLVVLSVASVAILAIAVARRLSDSSRKDRQQQMDANAEDGGETAMVSSV